MKGVLSSGADGARSDEMRWGEWDRVPKGKVDRRAALQPPPQMSQEEVRATLRNRNSLRGRVEAVWGRQKWENGWWFGNEVGAEHDDGDVYEDERWCPPTSQPTNQPSLALLLGNNETVMENTIHNRTLLIGIHDPKRKGGERELWR
ncbi:unnamed protein product [Tuber aestivum]|uniref:Uncharacterized protein n=1 Tax=Tuber aestivum TaxID=59557 RepID=A0A292PHZ9_9PEZI|nr:unnamed protein product [Tuber aestivum]